MIKHEKIKQEESTDENLQFVAVIGIGGAGSNVLDKISLQGLEGAELFTMNTDVRALNSSATANRIQLGTDLTHGLGCGGDPEMGRQAADYSKEQIRDILKGRTMVFLCVGLGGGTGSGAAPEIAAIAQEEGAFVVVFANLPFVFEGKRRLDQAEHSLDLLSRHANALITFENDKLGQLVLPKQGIQEAFLAGDEVISQSVRAVTTLVKQPGLIRIGMDEILSTLRNSDSRCLFGFGTAKGQNRATTALKRALESPLLDKGKMLEDVHSLIVHISGGKSLTLFEIETLMGELRKSVHPEAQIFFGAGMDTANSEQLSVTIISSATHEAAEAVQEPEIKHEAPPAAVAPPPVEKKIPKPVVEEEPVAQKNSKDLIEETINEDDFLIDEETEEWEKEIIQELRKDEIKQAPQTNTERSHNTGDNNNTAKTKAGQQTIDFDSSNRGRFEKSEPTVEDGEDLDVPAYLRGKKD